jgi:hypothetical protein
MAVNAKTKTDTGLARSVQSGHTMVQHANLQGAASWLGCKLHDAPSELQKSLALCNRTHKPLVYQRRATAMALREQQRINWYSYFEEVAAIESEVRPFFEAPSKEKEALEEDALAQLSFQSEWLRPVNHVPFAVAIVAFFKVWAVPFMSVLTPILSIILPYLLLKYVYALPIDQTQFKEILQGLWSGHPFDPEKGISSLWSGRSVAQMIFFAFSFLQSLVQPVQNAIHLYKTDKVFYGIGRQLVRLSRLVQKFRTELGELNGPHVKLSHTLQSIADLDNRAAFMLIKEQPERLWIVLRDLARLEVLWRIAEKEELQPVRFTASEFVLDEAIDISLDAATAQPSSLQLRLGSGENPHAVLTGPNGGGKSSFLRAVLQCVLLGQSYGMAPSRGGVQMPFLGWIASGLQLRDTPGELSMFETEVKFAADTLSMQAGPHGPGLLLFDELFHSTNPPDGIRTAEKFLRAVWAKSQMFSIVSTHVFSLIESAPANVTPICCQAAVTEKGDIEFSYRVEPGICRVSSVEKVWRRFGLVATAGPRPTAAAQTLPSEENHAV